MSFDFAAEKQRRIEQFEKALAPMHRRTVQIVQDCCFAIFEERNDDFFATPSLKAVKQIEKPSVVSVGSLPVGSLQDDIFGMSDSMPFDFDGWSDEGWRQDEKSNRFIQFVFLEHHFEMDLPRPMLWPNEAKTILQTRTGFFFLGDRGDAAVHAETVKNFHPLRKAYVHGDSYSAAEDIAYLFFTLWKFPIDSTLYLSTFGGEHTWDHGVPLT